MLRIILALASLCLVFYHSGAGKSPSDPVPILKDIHGSPLPVGAIARLGSLRRASFKTGVDITFVSS
jgi:hypothetical protein